MRKSEGVFLIGIMVFIVLYGLGTLLLNKGIANKYEEYIDTGEYKISVLVMEPYGEREGTVVLIHGILASKNMMKSFATDLVRYGWRVILIDQPGHGKTGGAYKLKYDDLQEPEKALEKLINQSYEFRSAVASYLRNKVDDEYVVFGGHSLGGLFALLMSRDYDRDFNILATIAIAPPYVEGIVNSTIPRNILLCIGKYDEFIFVDDLKRYINPKSPSSVEVGNIIGDFSNGTARRIYVSPNSDHIFEPYDPAIIEESIKWLGLCLGKGLIHVVVLSTTMASLKALAALAGLVVVSMSPLIFADRLGMISGGKRFPTIKLIKSTIIAAFVVWPLVTSLSLFLFLSVITGIAGKVGYIIPILVGGYLFVATIALIAASMFLSGKDVDVMIRKVYLYIRSDLRRCIILGSLEAAIFLFILDVTLGDIFMPMTPRSVGRILISIPLGLMIFGYFIFHEYLFRAQIQEIFGGKKRRAALISIMISLLSKMVVIVIISALIYFISPFQVVALAGMFGMILVAVLTEGLAATSYYATREILPHALASAVLWASIATAAFPVVMIT